MKLLEKLQTIRAIKTHKEEGFTLVEIMVAVIVIAILAGISVPLFSAQQRNAVEASLKQDLRNAGIIMRTEAQSTPAGRMISYLPSYATQTGNNRVTLDAGKSNIFNYCLVGINPDINVTLYYASYTGKISSDPCPTLPSATLAPPSGGGSTPGGSTPTTGPNAGIDPNSFTAEQKEKFKTKKVVLVSSGNSAVSSRNQIASFLVDGYGFQAVDQMNESAFLANSATDLKNKYEMVVFYFSAWAPGSDIMARAYEYYNIGGKVLHDGNDTGPSHSPFIATTFAPGESAAMFTPTFNQGLKPTFPYTFSATAFASDSSWVCPITLANGAVSIAEDTIKGRQCITLYAASNSSGGRWVAASYFYNGIQSPVKAGIDWLHA